MWGREGALCLSWWPDDGSGLREATRSHPHQDKHKAPASTPRRPLSLQEAGRPFPAAVGHSHQEAGPQASPWVGLPHSVGNIHKGPARWSDEACPSQAFLLI